MATQLTPTAMHEKAQAMVALKVPKLSPYVTPGYEVPFWMCGITHNTSKKLTSTLLNPF